MKRVLIILMMALLSISANGATYYFSPLVGSDSNSGLSPSLSKKTFAAVNFGGSGIPGGSTILLDGTNFYNGASGSSYYMNFPQIGGSSNSPFVVSNWGGTSWGITNCLTTTAIVANNLQWVIWYNMVISNNHQGVDFQSVTNCTWSGGIVANNTNSNFQLHLNSVSNYFTNFSCTNLSGGGSTCSDRDGGSISFYEGNYESTTDHSGYNIYEGVTMGYDGHSALELAGVGSACVNSTFFNPAWYQAPWYNNTCPAIGLTTLTGGSWWGGRVISLGGQNSSGILFDGNTVAYSGLVADQPPALHLENCGNCIIRRNTIYGATACGIEVNGESLPGPAGNNALYNNTITQCGFDISWYISGGTQFQVSYAEYQHSALFSSTSNILWVNNLMFNNFSDAFQNNDSPSFPIFNAGNMYGVNPLWVNTNSSLLTLNPSPLLFLNLGLASNSPAISSGSWLLKVSSASGTGTSLTVYSNASMVYAGQTAAYRTLVGDTLSFQNSTQTSQIASITGNTITFIAPVTWVQGQGLALAGFLGSSPDVGALAYGSIPPIYPIINIIGSPVNAPAANTIFGTNNATQVINGAPL